MSARREQATKLRRRMAREKLLGAKLRNQQEAARQARAKAKAQAAERKAEELQAKATVKRKFGSGALGQGEANGGGPAHEAMRGELLDRLRQLYPLSEKQQPLWDDFRAWYPAWIGQNQGPAVGSYLIRVVEDLRKSTKEHPFGDWMLVQLRSRGVHPKDALSVLI